MNILDNLAYQSRYKQDIEVSEQGVGENKLHSNKQYDGSSNYHYVNLYYNGVLNKWITLKIDVDYKTSKTNNQTDIDDLQQDGVTQKVLTSNTASSDLYATKVVLKDY